MGTPTEATKGTPDEQTITIPDNDDPPNVSFSIDAQAQAESVGTITVTVELDVASSREITVPFTVGGTATEGAGNDYTITSSPATIAAGDTSADITITVNDDGSQEGDETVVVTLGTPTNASKATPDVHTATITDDDLPTVNFTTDHQSHEEDIGTMTATVELDAVSTQDISVPFSLGGSATQGGGDDYTITASPVTITAGNLSTNITITVNNDTDTESDESIVITMGTPTNALKGMVNVHTANIEDDDAENCSSVVAGEIQRNGGNKWIYFDLTNNTSSDCKIVTLDATWYNKHSIAKIMMTQGDGNQPDIYDEEEKGGVTIGITDWKDYPDKQEYRVIPSGANRRMIFEFTKSPKNLGYGVYSFTIGFEDGQAIVVTE